MKARVLFAHRARRIFFFVHLWLGLILGIWFSLLGLSGSVLAWRFELQGWELSQRFPIEKNASNGEMISLSQAIAAFKTAHPDARPKEFASVTIPNRKMPFYAFARGKDRKSRKTIVVDPYSAKVHPPVQMRTLMVGTIQQFHQRLISGAKGYVLNGFLNFLAIPLVLSGLWLWWPTQLKHLKTHLSIKRGVSLKRTLYDLHNMMGIYLYPFLLLTTVTGAMLVQQHVSADGGVVAFLQEENTPPREKSRAEPDKPKDKKPEEKKSETPRVTPQGERLQDGELLESARKVRPQFELARLELPQRPDQPLQLTFSKPTGLNLNETVLLNPYSGEEISNAAKEPETRSPLRQWTKVLHLGEYGGVITKTIYTVTGLMPLGLFLTGFLLWARKKRAKMKKAAAIS
jgi:uncharacterized iron-regulated membrane protein